MRKPIYVAARMPVTGDVPVRKFPGEFPNDRAVGPKQTHAIFAVRIDFGNQGTVRSPTAANRRGHILRRPGRRPIGLVIRQS